MRGAANDFRETWAKYTVATPAGELAYTVFPGPVPFVGCSMTLRRRQAGRGLFK